MNKVITINRQFSSGGREVAKRLADALDYAYYDKELLKSIAENSELSEEFLNNFDEKFTRSYTYTFGRTFAYPIESPGDKVQMALASFIKEIPTKHNAVIVGRCANNILEDKDIFKVFIYSSDMEFRIDRCFEKVPSDEQTKTRKQIKKEILSIDKQRARYYEYYTGQVWQDMNTYNLCVDTSSVGINGAVDLIMSAVTKK